MSFSVQSFSSSSPATQFFSGRKRETPIPLGGVHHGDSVALSSQSQQAATPHFGKGKGPYGISSGKYYGAAGKGLGLFSNWLGRSIEYDTERYGSRRVYYTGQDRRYMHHYDIYESPRFPNDDGRYGGYAFSRRTSRSPRNYFRDR